MTREKSNKRRTLAARTRQSVSRRNALSTTSWSPSPASGGGRGYFNVSGADIRRPAGGAFELASAAFQIGIVLASATIITGIIALAWISGLLTLAGIAFTALGVFAPHLLHLP